MIFGIIATVAFLVVGAIVLFYKAKINSHSKRINITLFILSLLIVLLTGIHLIMVIGLLRQRPMLMNISGFIMFGIIIFSFIFTFIPRSSKPNKSLLKWIIISVFILLCIHIYSGIDALKSYKEDISQIEVKNIDITKLPDGMYEGEHDVGYIYAHVSVTVNSGKITAIDLLEHRHERGEAAEKVINDIVLQQELEVDAISSVTNSSNVIKKAVENALLSALY